jgi:hypothetical protein
MLLSTLSLSGWEDIAQFVIAIAACIALLGAFAQLRLARANARRGRVYEYADRFNEVRTLRASAAYRIYWEQNTYADYDALKLPEQLECMRLPNLIEEVAFLYNRNLLDRNVAAELLGVYVERLWEASAPLIDAARDAEKRSSVFSEWEEMQRDTPARKERAQRRRARRKFLLSPVSPPLIPPF